MGRGGAIEGRKLMGRMSEFAMLADDLAAAQYPKAPGYKEPSTSRMAAKAIRSRAHTISERILALLAKYPNGLTPDAAAALLGISILACRPRFSELSAKGKIKQSGVHRVNTTGLRAHVWVLA